MTDTATEDMKTAEPEKTPEQVVQELAEAVGRWPARKLADLQQEFIAPPKEDPFAPKDFWPGRISYYGERGAFTGAKLKKFYANAGDDPVDQVNSFFEKNPRILCCDYKFLDNGDIIILYTSRLDEDEQAEYDEFTRKIEGDMAEWRRQRQQDKLMSRTEKEIALGKLLELAVEGQRYTTQVKPNLKAEKKEKKKGKK